MAANAPGRYLQDDEKADVLLVTVTDVEFDAIRDQLREQFGREPQHRFKDDKTYFDLGEIDGACLFLVNPTMMGAGGSASHIRDYAACPIPTREGSRLE